MAKMKCPECGSTGMFYITAQCCVELDGVSGYIEECDEIKWTGTAPCTCAECYYEGMYKDFRVYEED